MTIKQNSVVHIHYTLTNDAGDVLDSSAGKEPLMYMHGHHNLIQGLEDQLLGKAAGDKFDATVEAEDGYGLHHEEAIQQIPMSALANIPNLEVGMQLQASTEQGPVSVRVVELTDEYAVLDGNHPLAGERLHFAVEVVTVRDATPSELEHGHAHSGDGHHH
ncbi:MAG: FKBP-type peptidyl-prolyl cis-trans isomerase [Formosimonas sp.]